MTTESDDARQRGVAQFYGLEVFEHYERDGSLLVVTSDASAIRLEPGDFIVKRLWSTAVMPYVYNEARMSTPPAEPCCDEGMTCLECDPDGSFAEYATPPAGGVS